MIKIGIIGYGYWGPNLVRNFSESRAYKIQYVCDLEPGKLTRVKDRYPAIELTSDYKELLNSSDVDAIAIATPVSTHFNLALKALESGKHVLVEKPLAEDSNKCKRLIDAAQRRHLVLMVDHTFPYTAAVRRIRKLIEDNFLGEIYYYDSVRVNLGLFQHDVSVIWDLAVHDLSIIEFILKERPVAVSATGMKHFRDQTENIAYLTLFFDSNTIAHIHVNWLAPVKVRQTLIGGSQRMIVYNDLEPTEKIKIYDKGISLHDDETQIQQMRVGYRTGDMWAPNLEGTEALRELVEHFARCIEKGEEPLTGAESGLRVVRMMEAATDSMQRQGALVKL
jgi:predicted dehydrogenase